MAMVGRMAGGRERAFALMSEAKMQADSSVKTDTLKQLMEILSREPDVLLELVPHLMELQMDPSSPVLKYLAEIIEAVGLKSWDQLPVMVPALLALLRDSTPAVARRAISTGTNLFRNTLEQVALQGIYTGQVDARLQDAWAWMIRFKDEVYPAAYHHGNDGVRLQAIKFVETTILLFTPDSNGSSRPPPQPLIADGTPKGFNLAWIAGGHPVLDAAAMGQEASKNLGLLLNQLRPFESSTLPGPVAIVLVNSLAAVAKRRPSLYGRVLPVLLGLAPNCENIKGGQVASVVHALKNAFLSLLKCTHSAAGPWRDRLVGALRSMNAGDVAESTLRQIDRAMRNAERDRTSRDPRSVKDEKLQPNAQPVDASRKRLLMQENGNQSGASDGTNGKRMRAVQNSGAVQSMLRDGNSNEVPAVAVATRESGLTPIQQMISMIGALVAQGDRATASVELLITNIAPDMLADIVIANMIHLPATPPPVQVGVAGEVDTAGTGGIVALLSLGAGVVGPTPPAPIAVPPPVVVPAAVVPPLVIPPLVVPPVPEVSTPSQAPADVRRDPRRDPRLLDPRRASPGAGGSIASPKDVDTVMGGVSVSVPEPIVNPVDVKQEAQAPASVRDPRASLQTISSPRSLPAKVKSEPVDEMLSPSAPQTTSPTPVTAVSMPPTSVTPMPPVSIIVKQEPVDVTASSTATPAPSTLRDARTTSLSTTGLSAVTGGIPVNVPVPTIPVVSLTDEQQVALGKAALVRILEGHKTIAAAGGDSLRIALLARLVAQSCEDEGAIEVVRKHILADYQNHKGHELALHVLYQLYAEQASEEGNIAASSSPIFIAYDKLLISLAQGLRDTLPPSDKALSRLLAEAPVLPLTALQLLEGLCNPQPVTKEGKEASTGDRITQGLSAIWSLILQRPPARETCLKMALQCAVHEVDDIRAKAIRLVANKLYPLDYISQSVEHFALDKLRSVVEAPQDAQADVTARDIMDVDEGDTSEGTAMKDVGDQEKVTNGADQRADQGLDEVKAEDLGAQNLTRISGTTVSMTEAQRCMSLFFALCTKKHSLLHQLFSVYGTSSKAVKQAVHRHIPILFRTIGSSSPDLLQIITDPPVGSENLLLQVLHSLTEGNSPSPELISTVKKLYETKLQFSGQATYLLMSLQKFKRLDGSTVETDEQKYMKMRGVWHSNDAVFLIPVLSSLTKDEVLPIFPRLVDLAPEKFQTALARILQGSAHTGPALTPTEVLIALHGIDPQRDAVPLKKVMDACSACLQQRTVFTQQVLARVLNQLVEQTPLPLLFMRTVIQAVGAFPTLVSFVMEILSRLVNKQIWKFPKLWIGFLKCANQTVPHSFHVLLQLPAVQLDDALIKHPALKAPLAAHASQANVRSTVPRSSLVLLGLAAQDETTAAPLPAPESSTAEVQVKH